MDLTKFFKKHKNIIPIFLILGIFLFYLSLYIVQEKLITQDGTLWISYGLQIFQGDLFTFQFDGGAPSFSPLVYSPGYPFLVGLVNLVIQNPIFSAYLISMLMSALLCLVVFYISRNLFNEKIGYISLLLCGVYTGMKHYATETWIRSTGMFFLLLGLYLFMLSLKKNKMVYPLLTGAVLGAAVLVRFEFALYPILSAVLFLFYVVRKKLKFRSLVYFSAALVIVYSVYAVPLYLYSGYKLLSPYISEKLLDDKMPDKHQYNYYPNRDLADYIVLFNNNTASSINLSKQNKVKVSQEDWEQYGNQENSTSDTRGIFGNYKQMFQQILPLVFRWHIIGFFLLGIYYHYRKRKTQSFGLYGLIGITLLFYPLGSVEAIRYYHHLQPLILIIASCGIFLAAQSVKKILKTGVVYYAIIALVLGLYIWNDVTRSLQTSYNQQELVWLEAADYFKENAEVNSIIIARKNYAAFYSNMRTVTLPDEQEIEDVWEYSKHIGADWLMIDKQLTDGLMTQFSYLLEEQIPDYLEIKKELFKGTEYFTRIFKIKH